MYHAVDFVVSEDQVDILNAFLLDEFDTIEFTNFGFSGYLPKDHKAGALIPRLKDLQTTIPFTFSEREIPEKNWNRIWESNFAPVEIGDFCRVYADFHEPKSGFAHEIIINPKMAFGTGHHETTHMMIQAMEHLSMDGKIWDFGTGTGILAILARKMGAKPGIFANDIEAPAIDNCIENMEINHLDGIDFKEGGIEVVPDTSYDLVLANINRNVILSNLEPLVKRLSSKGQVLFSGILKQDYQTIIDHCKEHGLIEQMYFELNNWVCTLLQRQS